MQSRKRGKKPPITKIEALVISWFPSLSFIIPFFPFFEFLDDLWCAMHNLCLTVCHKSQLATYFISPQSFGRAEVWLIVFTWISGLAVSDRQKGALHAEVQLCCFSMRNQAIGSWRNFERLRCGIGDPYIPVIKKIIVIVATEQRPYSRFDV